MATLARFPELVALGPVWGRALLAVAARLGLSADEIAATIWLESRGDPHAISPSGKRAGFFQWSDDTARACGTSFAGLLAMGPVEQLAIVERFLRPYRRACKRPGDVRLAVFAPAGLGLADAEPLPLSPSTVAANAALDRDGNGVMTAGEIRGACLGALAGRGRWELEAAANAGADAGAAFVVLPMVATGLYLLTR